MSSPATAAFLAAWRDRGRRAPRTLAKIEISSPSAVTLRVASAQIVLPDGTVWEAGLGAGRIRARVDRLGTGPNPADCTIVLAERLYPFMASGTVSDTLAGHQWQGAKVTLYLWNDVRDANGAQVLAAADLFEVFPGVVDSYSIGDAGLTLTLLDDRAYNKPLPPTSVDKVSYPDAPDSSQGQPIPIVYGDHGALPMRAPASTAFGNKSLQEDSGGALGAVPMVLVDPGLGAAKVKLVGAGHACARLLDRTSGYSQFIGADDVLAPLDTGSVTEVLGAGESYITVDDGALIAYYGARPIDTRTGGVNTATSPRKATDVIDETSFAVIDQGAGAGVLELTLPNVGPLGYVEAVQVVLAFVGNAANGNTLRVLPQIPGGLSGTAVASSLGQAQATTLQVLTGTWDANYAGGQSWQLGGQVAGTPIDVKVEFTGGTTNKAHVHWVAIRVKFRPQRNLVTPAIVRWDPRPGSKIGDRMVRLKAPDFGRVPVTVQPDQFKLEGQFFGNIKGYADDGSGTFTGAAGALIQQPCDIARHLLATYGLESSFETGATAFGSFVLARGVLRNGAPTDFKLACWIGSQTSVQQVLQDVCSQGLLCVYRDRFSGKWLCHVWRRGGTPDYDLTFEDTDIISLECGVASDVDLNQGVRINWGYDWFRNRALFETFVNAAGSSQGFNLPTVRDQILTVVVNVNDDLDWSKGASTYADVLTPGTYSPIDLAAEMQARMRTHSSEVHVWHGFTIKAGFNDKLDFIVGASTYAATLAAGEYNAEALAYEVARALTAASGSRFTVAYVHSGNLFRVAITSGTYQILVHTGANVGTTGWCVLGFNQLSTVAASHDSDTRVFADRFQCAVERYAGATTFVLKWATGASSATNCAELLGDNRQADTNAGVAPGNIGFWNGALARSYRETLCAASQAAFGPRQDQAISAPWVRDESSGQQLRDRIFDFGSEPPVWARITSHMAPDMQRFRTVQLGATVDGRRPYPKFGSDGSWVGKVLRVLEVEMDLEASYHTEFYAEEA